MKFQNLMRGYKTRTVYLQIIHCSFSLLYALVSKDLDLNYVQVPFTLQYRDMLTITGTWFTSLETVNNEQNKLFYYVQLCGSKSFVKKKPQKTKKTSMKYL